MKRYPPVEVDVAPGRESRIEMAAGQLPDPRRTAVGVPGHKIGFGTSGPFRVTVLDEDGRTAAEADQPPLEPLRIHLVRFPRLKPRAGLEVTVRQPAQDAEEILDTNNTVRGGR
jgi:hypothetical protein